MKITAFCMLAEPEKLMYPYLESITSVTHFVDEIIINFAAADSSDQNHRQFEEQSYNKIIELQNKVKDYCKITIKLDKNWKYQKNQSYEELRLLIQKALDDCNEGWFFKFDADHVFNKKFINDIKSLFDDQTDRINFGRVNVVNKNTITTNLSSQDTYAINITNLKNKNLRFEVGDQKNWCQIVVCGNYNTKTVNDLNLMPFNYDATFFTKERIIDFWKKTEEAYSFVHNRINRFENMTNEEVMNSFFEYKKKKNSNNLIKNFTHPEDIKEKIENISDLCWGYNNFM